MSETATTSKLFPGYNLRGLIVAYLEEHGWEWYDGGAETEDTWLLPGRIQFEGNFATDRAMHWQMEHEEGRA